MVHSPAFAFLNGVSGRIVDEMIAFDWTTTSLGSPDTWPAALKAQIATMMACPAPMYLVWGPDLVSFYNDAYRPMLGYRAATAMGTPFRILWGSIWDDIAPLVDVALSGKVAQVTDMRLDLAREGKPEEAYWSFSYSPVFDDQGQISGMICVTGETTARVSCHWAGNKEEYESLQKQEQQVRERIKETFKDANVTVEAQHMNFFITEYWDLVIVVRWGGL